MVSNPLRLIISLKMTVFWGITNPPKYLLILRPLSFGEG